MSSKPPLALIVDDEPHICGLISEKLTEHGFSVRSTTEPKQALELLASLEPDVLITNVDTPRSTGLGLLAHVHENSLGCKVILITGRARRECLSQAIILGAYDYMETPLKMPDLIEVVSKAVSEAPGDHLADKAAVALELVGLSRRASLDSVRALVLAVEAKDPYTRRHSEQVTHYAVNLAAALNLPQEMIESLRVAALLHDIGKIGVPDAILTKQGLFTAEEYEIMRLHPALGAELLSNITLFSQEARSVRHHHERWDGKGYPDSLAGEESPLLSRIMQVADSMDAMLMERGYKKSLSVEGMLAELVRGAGTQFDPKIVAVALQWCRANPDQLILPGMSPVAELRSS